MALFLHRKIDDYLIEWKKNKDRLPLIIRGARQVGKTSSIEHFAATYRYFVEINFIAEPQYKNILQQNHSHSVHNKFFQASNLP